ncbi:MAG: hypothetical protein DYG89_12305 [Caldilinea sp. CFX5]|nr:hypothetical protein [Caldilinea sp. CFX5]
MLIDQWFKPTNNTVTRGKSTGWNKQHRWFGSALRLLSILVLLLPQVALAQGSSPDVGSDVNAPHSTADAQADEAFIQANVPPAAALIRTINTANFATPSSDPTGIVYLPSENRFLVTDSEVEEIPAIFQGANLFYVNITGTLVLTATTTSYSAEPTDVTFNPNNGYLYIADDVKNRIYEIQGPGPDNIYGTNDEPLVSFRTDITLGVFDLESLAYGQIGGVDTIFFADGSTHIVFMMQPGPNGVFNAGGDDIITSFNAETFGVTSIEGLAYHPTSGTLYVSGTPKTRIAQVTTAGQLIRLIDTTAVGADKPSGLGFGPGAGGLYMTDRVKDNINDGKIFELGLPTATAGNQPPVTDAGPNIVVNLPVTSTTMAGVVTDDGIPGGLLTTKWTVVAGRSVTRTVAFGNNDSLTTPVGFSKPGTYVLRLTADDNELASVDLVTVTVNALPVVTVSPDQAVAIDTGAALTATVTDDGLPTPSFITTTWSLVSGPGQITFTNPSALQTNVAFGAAGAYVIKFSANDGGGPVEKLINVTVNAVNRAPVVDAGLDQTIALAGPATLAGSVVDDGLPVTGTLTTQWSMIAGPGTVNFANATAAATTATFSAPGLYQLQLSASDGTLSATDTTSVTVAAANNNPPTVNAGADQIIVATGSATLSGSATDDGQPNPPATLTVTWSKVSGPGTVTFANPNAANTTATFSAPGVYVLALSANDGDVAADDFIEIVVNEAPKVAVGPAKTVDVNQTFPLTGTVTDDGRPTPANLTITWSKVSGPGNVTFATPNAANTTATIAQAGQYVLRLTANDGHTTTSATINITVNTPNKPPVVSAGVNLTVTTSAPVNLDGTVTDDGVPSNVITTTWNKVSGPGTVTFGNPNAVDTTASFSAAGTYVLRLTADDGQLDASATVRLVITVPTKTTRNLFLPLVRK